MNSEILSFYLQPGPRGSVPGRVADQFPGDPAGIVARIQKLIIHVERIAREKLRGEDEIRALRKPVTAEEAFAGFEGAVPAELDPVARVPCICRNYAMLTAAILRAKGVPARSRCGFGIYFDLGYFEDHWICEYWHRDERRWVRVDAQVDEYWRERLGLRAEFFDNLDVRAGQFLPGGQVWQMYRAGGVDPRLCGFSLDGEGGEYYIRGNMLRDFFALNGIEYTYQEQSRLMRKEVAPTPEEYGVLDEVGRATIDPDASFEELRKLYTARTELRPEEGGR